MSANTTTDATATPRTDEAEFFMSTSDKQSPDEGCMMVEAYFARTLERELTAAKAEIARLSNLGWFGKYHKAEADNAQLRAQLRERTQWQCACGGTDCAGAIENERLRAALDVAEGALKIIAKADDKGWCEDGYADTVAEQALARIAELRK